jgi:hypothetical protein
MHSSFYPASEPIGATKQSLAAQMASDSSAEVPITL